MIDGLDAPMTGDGCRAERMTEKHREDFRADESFDEGTHIDRILRSEHVKQDLEEE